MQRWRKYVLLVLVISFMVYTQCKNREEKSNMQTIQFFPKEFQNIKLGLSENEMNKCTPHYPNTSDMIWNEIVIASPQKILFPKGKSSSSFVIPICGFYVVTEKRGLKYANKKKEVHIKDINMEAWIIGEIVEDTSNEHPILPPNHEQAEKEKQIEIEEAQKYKDSELDEGQASGSALNINALNYIKGVPLKSGKYEIYITMSGLESNHVEVEIINVSST